MRVSHAFICIGSAAALTFAVMTPASAMPASPRSSGIDSSQGVATQVRDDGNRNWKGGANWRGDYRGGHRPGHRYWNRPGHGWGWWGPGIVGGVVGTALAAPYYYGGYGAGSPGMCRVWGPGYWTYAPCPY